jgi:hypothetical protein
VARRLAGACPAALGEEIAVTGSVALGLADDASDLELNLWSATLPSVEERGEWIARIGGTEAQIAPEPWSDGSLHATFRYGDLWVEAGWMTLGALDAALRAILAAEVLGHARLQLAWVVERAVPVRTAGGLAAWQARLMTYPEALGERLIEVNTRVFGLPHAMRGRWTYCRRSQPLALTERLTWETYNVLRLLFARNRRWEPDFKWLRQVTGDLAVAPERVAERIEAVFTLPRLEDRVATSLALIRDTLALLPDTPGVARARETIDGCLRLAPQGARPPAVAPPAVAPPPAPRPGPGPGASRPR